MADIERVERMYAYLIVDTEHGMEGVPAFMDPELGTWMPMVGADIERMQSLREIAREIADKTGEEITLCVFEGRVDIEKYQPVRSEENGR